MTTLIAAVATPIRDDRTFDEQAFDRLVAFLNDAGVDGVCIGGATGEFPHFEVAERLAVIRRAGQRVDSHRQLLVAVGSSSVERTVALGRAAMDAGSQAVLLPMPMFFRYQQEDIRAYAALTSRAIDAPCLLYDLPDFTNGLAPETSVSLMEEEPQIAGIKDSSGRSERLSMFADARSQAKAGGKNLTLLVGDDKLLRAGLEAGWDGAISGVAGCCPELLVALVKNFNAGKTDEVTRLQARLDELIARLSVFPTPWGIRIALQARGIETGPLPLPVTPGRRSQIEAFQSWFTRWIE